MAETLRAGPQPPTELVPGCTRKRALRGALQEGGGAQGRRGGWNASGGGGGGGGSATWDLQAARAAAREKR